MMRASKQPMRLFRWGNTYIAARTVGGARALLLEHYTPSEVRQRPITPFDGELAVSFGDEGPYFNVAGTNVENIWAKPQIIPEG